MLFIHAQPPSNHMESKMDFYALVNPACGSQATPAHIHGIDAAMLSYVVHTASSFVNPWNRTPPSTCSSEIVLSSNPPERYFLSDKSSADDPTRSLIDRILCYSDLYAVLGVGRLAGVEELRRAYMSLCRQCHPDKFPNEPRATEAFQRLSYAYSILSDPHTRRLYDTKRLDDSHGRGGPSAEDTFNYVLQAVWADFLDGDFEIIRLCLRSLNETNPSLGFGEDKTEALLRALVDLRDMVIFGQQHLRLIKFELIRLYEIQHTLRQLSYFDITGRLKLTMQLARLTIALPINVDKAIMAAQHDTQNQPDDQVQLHRGRYLPSSIHSVINLACSVLETGERVLPSRA